MNVDVECQNDDCSELFDTFIENEDAGEGSEHKIECDKCGRTTSFELSYFPSAVNEELVQ